MHQHNSKHMWWMLAGCIVVPFLLLAFIGNGAVSGGNWLLFGILALCVGSHIAMMSGGGHGGGHADGADEKTDATKRPTANGEQTHKGCCH